MGTPRLTPFVLALLLLSIEGVGAQIAAQSTAGAWAASLPRVVARSSRRPPVYTAT